MELAGQNCTPVTNTQISDTLNSNDNKRIIHKVFQKYSKLLDKDELESIKLVAVWQCLKSFDSNKSRFTTHLFNCVRWECQKFLRNNFRYTTQYNKEVTTCGIEHSPANYELLESLTDDEKDLIIQKYVYKKTLKEIGLDIGLSSEGVRKRINKIKTRLKNEQRNAYS